MSPGPLTKEVLDATIAAARKWDRICAAAPDMLALLREIEADWTRSNWGTEIRALLERIDD